MMSVQPTAWTIGQRVEIEDRPGPSCRLPGPNARWYAVAVKRGLERLGVTEIEGLGFAVEQPWLKRAVVSKRTQIIETREEPLFPGYLFVRFDVADGGWVDIQYCRGVIRILSEGHGERRPLPLPKGLVEHLRVTYPATSGELNEDVSAPIYQVGQEVWIDMGKYGPTLGRIASLDRRHRVAVLIRLFGRDFEVEGVSLGRLRRAG